jgi:hypothetical protein
MVDERSDELVIDCLVAERIVAGPGRAIARGTPFTMIVNPAAVVGGTRDAIALLEHWSETCDAVEATGSLTDGMIRLRAEGRELVLDVP